MATGGPIEELSLKGRPFAVAEDSDPGIDLGGFSNENQANGNGTFRVIKTRKLAKIDGIAVVIDQARDDHQYIQDLADSPDPFDVAITYSSGTTYSGKMQIEGDIAYSPKNATIEITLTGSKMDKQ